MKDKEKIKALTFMALGALIFLCGAVIFIWLEYNRVEVSDLKFTINNFKEYIAGLLVTTLGAWFVMQGLKKY